MNRKLLSEKLHQLSKEELAVLQRMMFAIETRFYREPGEKYDDFFRKERFGKIEEFELFRMARILNEDFKVLSIEERDGRAFTISFRYHDYHDFLEFKKMVGKELNREDGTSVDKIYRPVAFKDGSLIGGRTTRKLVIKREDSHEYKILQKALELPLGDRIDVMEFSETDDITFQQIYDTARRLNKKIEETLEIKDFFKFDYPNKFIIRVVQ